MFAQVYLYVDGSCRGNPGPGGYAAILQYGRHEREIVGGQRQTTNNRMELAAVIAGLQALKRRCRVVVVTDSQYVIRLLAASTRAGQGGRLKANRDLLQTLAELADQHQIQTEKINGHAGHSLNERAHQLAYAEATRQLGQGTTNHG